MNTIDQFLTNSSKSNPEKLALLKRDKQILSKKPTFDIDFQYKNSETSASSSSNDFQSYGTILTFKTPLFNNRSEKHLILSLHDEYKSKVKVIAFYKMTSVISLNTRNGSTDTSGTVAFNKATNLHLTALKNLAHIIAEASDPPLPNVVILLLIFKP